MSCDRTLEMITKLIEVDAYRGMEAQYTLQAIKEMIGIEDDDFDPCCVKEDPKNETDRYSKVTSINVESSWIDEFDYDSVTKELIMRTHNGREYLYYNVPVELWYDLCQAIDDGESAGSFYNDNIKGQFKSEEI